MEVNFQNEAKLELNEEGKRKLDDILTFLRNIVSTNHGDELVMYKKADVNLLGVEAGEFILGVKFHYANGTTYYQKYTPEQLINSAL